MNWKGTFAIIWSGQAFSFLTSAVVQFALVWWLTKETGSASVLAIATIAALLPQVILGPFIGVWVDRYNRKLIMMLSDLFIALCSAIIAILYHFNAIEIWHIYILLVMRSIGSGFYLPALQASVPLLAPESQLTRVSGITQFLQSVTVIAGPALGAMLMVAASMKAAMMLDVAGAIIASSSLLFVKIPMPERKYVQISIFADMMMAFNAILKNKPLSILFLTWIICVFCYMPVNAFFPLMTFSHFGGGAIEMGIVEAAFGVGMLAGAAVISIFASNKHKVLMICVSYLMFGGTLLASGLLPPSGFVFYAILVGVMGLAVPLFNTPMTVIIQTEIEPEMLGRVFALYGTMSFAPAMLGLVVTSLVGDTMGVVQVFIAAGVLLLALGIVSLGIPALKKLG